MRLLCTWIVFNDPPDGVDGVLLLNSPRHVGSVVKGDVVEAVLAVEVASSAIVPTCCGLVEYQFLNLVRESESPSYHPQCSFQFAFALFLLRERQTKSPSSKLQVQNKMQCPQQQKYFIKL